jgi:GMP synthase-like glutamine amidotransferase
MGLAPQQRILQWHEDTFEMPKGAVPLMSGSTIRNQTFRYGRTSYAFQCHFEVSPELAEQWFSQWGHTIVRRYEEQAGRAVLARAQGEIAQHGARAADFCRVVTERWASLVQDAREGRAA